MHKSKGAWLYVLTTGCSFLDIFTCKHIPFHIVMQRIFQWNFFPLLPKAALRRSSINFKPANEHIMARATCCLQELNLAQHSWQVSTVSGAPDESAQEQPPSKPQAGGQAVVCRDGRHSALYLQPCQRPLFLQNIEHRTTSSWSR